MDTTTVERHSGAIKRALFSCLSCGCGYEAEHKRKFCIPCADAKERARLKERDAARKAKRAAEGRSLLDRTPEEKAAAKRQSRIRQYENERLKAKRHQKDAHVKAYRTEIAKRKKETRRADIAAKKAERAAKPWNNPGLTEAQKWRVRYRLDPDFNIRERIRTVTRKGKHGRLAEYVRAALKNNRKATTIERLLGYPIPTLRNHIERQFTRGMDWGRFCSGDIHIDHIRPLSGFNMSDPEQAAEAWALTNLRPLWAKDNVTKGRQRTHLL